MEFLTHERDMVVGSIHHLVHIEDLEERWMPLYMLAKL